METEDLLFGDRHELEEAVRQKAMKRYKTIVIDPPWKYGNWGKGSKNALVQGKANQSAPLPYAAMSIEEIGMLPINKLADKDCEVYLWATQKYLPNAFSLIQSWGLKYCQILTWCKAPMGTGQGGVYCPTTEFLLLARKGKMPEVDRVDSTWWQIKRQSKHSKKPEFFQDIIEGVTNEPRLEMFARREREGWDVFGDEVQNSIDITNYI